MGSRCPATDQSTPTIRLPLPACSGMAGPAVCSSLSVAFSFITSPRARWHAQTLSSARAAPTAMQSGRSPVTLAPTVTHVLGAEACSNARLGPQAQATAPRVSRAPWAPPAARLQPFAHHVPRGLAAPMPVCHLNHVRPGRIRWAVPRPVRPVPGARFRPRAAPSATHAQPVRMGHRTLRAWALIAAAAAYCVATLPATADVP